MGLFDDALAAEKASPGLASLARSIFQQESSSGKNAVTSNAGAVGQMQILPGTFGEVADQGWDIKDPMHNMRAGIRYLAKMEKLAGGDPALAAAGYYGGPGGLAKARQGIGVSDPRNPNAPDTLRYGQEVVARMGGGKKMPVRQAPVEAPPIAQAPVQVPGLPLAIPENAVAQAQVAPAPLLASGEPDSWQQFNQAITPTQQVVNQPPLMEYGPSNTMNTPFQLAAINTRPDFRRFGAWGVKV